MGKAMFNFEKLDTWKRAVDFAGLVYRSTSTFPAEERFGLTNQMRRAAVSVSSNLAEGSSRSSKTDYARFVEIATGSLFEVVSQSHIARQQAFLSDTNFTQIQSEAEALGRMLSGLRNYLLPAEGAR
jgi:four helix bundle protein